MLREYPNYINIEPSHTPATQYISFPKPFTQFVPNFSKKYIQTTKFLYLNKTISKNIKYFGTLFSQFPNIKKVVMFNNAIQKIPAHTFSALINLEEINLERCGIEKVSAQAFTGCDALQEIRLVDNKITAFSVDMLPKSVVYLNMAYNDIKRLNLHNSPIKKLNITGNENFSIYPQDVNQSLEELYVSGAMINTPQILKIREAYSHLNII